MHSIDSSHIVAASFFIFMTFIIVKRFFNIGVLIDQDIHDIRTKINNAAAERERAYAELKEVGASLDHIDDHITHIMNDGKQRCDIVTQHMRCDIAHEIDQRQKTHERNIAHIKERFNQLFQTQLNVLIFERLHLYIHEHQTSDFHDAQLRRSLDMLNTNYS